VKGSIDQNSQIQAQNGQSIVQLNGTVNTAAAAANQANLDRIAATLRRRARHAIQAIRTMSA